MLVLSELLHNGTKNSVAFAEQHSFECLEIKTALALFQHWEDSLLRDIVASRVHVFFLCMACILVNAASYKSIQSFHFATPSRNE